MICFICKKDVEDTCSTDCNLNVNESCILCKGVCECIFHFHCLSSELKNALICPLHKTEWGISKIWN